MAEEDIAVRLSLRDRLRFTREAHLAARGIDEIGDQARQAATSMGVMNTMGQGLRRGALVGLKYGAIGAGGALLGLGAAGFMSVKAFMASEKTWNQTEAVIESTGGVANVTKDDLMELTGTIQSYSGISDEASAAGANMLLTFKNIRNGAMGQPKIFDRATVALADLSTAMGTDMKTSAIMMGKALNDPIMGLSAMRRVGIQFSDSQEQAITKMVESGNMMGAQTIMLKELESQFGGSAKKMGDSAEGQFNIFKETVGDAMERVGAKLLPVVTKLLPGLTKTISAVIDGLGPAIEVVAVAFGESLAPVMESLGPVLASLGNVFGVLAKAFAPVLTMIGEMAGEIIMLLMPALKPLANELGKALVEIMRELKPIIPDLVKAFVSLVRALIPILPVAAQLIVLLLKLSGPVIEKLAGLVTWLADWIIRPITQLLKGLVTNWSETWATVKEVLVWYWDGIKGFFGGIVHWFSTIPDKIARTTRNMWDGIKDSFKGVINTIIGWWNSLSFTLPEIRVPGTPVKVGGFTLSTPDIPTLHQGGTTTKSGAVNMRPGEEIVVLPPAASVIPLQAQERVTLAGGGGGRMPTSLRLIWADGRILGEATLEYERDKDARK